MAHDVAKCAQILQRWQHVGGKQWRADAGKIEREAANDLHMPSLRRIDVVLEGLRDALGKQFHRVVTTLELKSRRFEPRSTAGSSYAAPQR